MAFVRTNFSYEDDYIKLTRGDTLAFGFIVDGVENLDSAFFTCKKNYDDEDTILFKKSLGHGIEKTSEGYTVRVAPEETENAELGKYFFDIQLGVNDDIYTVRKGILELTFEVTKNE